MNKWHSLQLYYKPWIIFPQHSNIPWRDFIQWLKIAIFYHNQSQFTFYATYTAEFCSVFTRSCCGVACVNRLTYSDCVYVQTQSKAPHQLSLISKCLARDPLNSTHSISSYRNFHFLSFQRLSFVWKLSL